MVEWDIEAIELVGCNCAYGCPCQFNARPTHGDCQAVGAYMISKGHFGETRLDGLKAAGVLAWPGAIHEGSGKAQLVVDERADEDQRTALLTIMAGHETDPGATMWSVFASTMEEVFPPLFKPIETEIDVEARTGNIRVEGLIDLSAVPIRNPVTGEAHRARIDLPDGFEYAIAEMGSSTFATQGEIAISSQDSYAQLAYIHLNNHGVVRD